ncbi:MAG: ribosomal-processing cysteine protease Prp [Oscillospiraceae bacterium]|nr:ribosomal-processing cysteine protease Prp [Oscillospiraceae bacterium]
MTKAKFLFSEDTVVSFEISGHSGAGEQGSDIVCSAVSSAAYMTANTIIEIMGLSPKTEVCDGYMCITMNAQDARKAKLLTDGLYLHLKELSGQYPDNLKIERGVFDA